MHVSVCRRSEEKSPFLKFLVPRLPRRGPRSILEKLSTPSHLLAGRSPYEIFGRNFFMIIQFIPRVSGRAKCIGSAVTGCTDTYLTYPHIPDGLPDLLFCKWSDLIRPYTAGNSRPDKESRPSSVNSFRKYLRNSLPLEDS